MNWDRIEDNWRHFRDHVKLKWGRLTEVQLDMIAGKRDRLVGKIREAYGITEDETEKRLSEWLARQKEPQPVAK